MIFAIVAAIGAALVTASAHLSSLASLDVSRVMAGEYWRLFSGHLAHLSWSQFWLDAPVFGLLYATYSRKAAPSSAMLLALFAALSVSLAVVLAGIHQVYGGLSGLSCAALSAILLCMILRQPRQPLPYIVFLIYGLYLLFSRGSVSGVTVAHEAHAAGAVAGLLFESLRSLLASVTAKAVELFYKARPAAPLNP